MTGITTVEQTDKKKTVSPSDFGVNSFNGLFPLYLTWDLDGHFSPKVSTDRNEDDVHTRTIWLGKNNPVVFKYTIPVPLRRYMECDDAKDQLFGWEK